MKSTYTKTNWVNNKTPINADNLNNIENGVSELYQDALSLSDFIEGDGIKISDTDEGVAISLVLNPISTPPESKTALGDVGDYYISDDFIYFCISANTWIKLRLENFDGR